VLSIYAPILATAPLITASPGFGVCRERASEQGGQTTEGQDLETRTSRHAVDGQCTSHAVEPIGVHADRLRLPTAPVAAIVRLDEAPRKSERLRRGWRGVSHEGEHCLPTDGYAGRHPAGSVHPQPHRRSGRPQGLE